MQQEQQGSLLQEGIWVIDLTVDDPSATDGGDTYMVSAACYAMRFFCSTATTRVPCRRACGPEVSPMMTEYLDTVAQRITC